MLQHWKLKLVSPGEVGELQVGSGRGRTTPRCRSLSLLLPRASSSPELDELLCQKLSSAGTCPLPGAFLTLRPSWWLRGVSEDAVRRILAGNPFELLSESQRRQPCLLPGRGAVLGRVEWCPLCQQRHRVVCQPLVQRSRSCWGQETPKDGRSYVAGPAGVALAQGLRRAGRGLRAPSSGPAGLSHGSNQRKHLWHGSV